MPSGFTAQRLATLTPEVCHTHTDRDTNERLCEESVSVCVCDQTGCVCVTFCRILIVGSLVFDISAYRLTV